MMANKHSDQAIARKATQQMLSPAEIMDAPSMDMDESGHLTLSIDRSNHRFMAGDKFFNYQQYGALRSGGEVSLFSREYLGILVSAAQSSFTYAVMRYCVRPTLMNFLQLNRAENQAVIECLISLPTSFSLFCGLASDVLPIGGYRRKSYMLLGSAISFLMLLGLTILAGTINPTTTDKEGRGEYLIYYMLLILGSVAGTLVSKVATDARVIELSQREPLTSRGHIQINYLIFRALFECSASWLTSFLVNYDAKLKNYHLQVDMFYVLLVLCILALMPVPFVLMNCTEKNIQQNEVDMMHNMIAAGLPTTSAKALTTPMMRVKAFFRMCQQRAVWQIVLFLSILLATTRFFFGSANKALKTLAQLDANTSLRTDAIKFMVTIAVMIGWKIWWSNSDWRRTVNTGLVALVGIEVFRALMMLYVPSTRTQLFFDAMLCIMAVSDGVISIFSFIPATEIAEYGSEGATVGLLQSFRSCLAVATRTISDQAMSKVASVELKQGDGAIGTLCLLLMISYGVHAMAFFSVFLLPRQKLDAQQLRVYGGYSKIACGVLVIIFLAFFSFSTTINLKAVIDMAMGSPP